MGILNFVQEVLGVRVDVPKTYGQIPRHRNIHLVKGDTKMQKSWKKLEDGEKRDFKILNSEIVPL